MGARRAHVLRLSCVGAARQMIIHVARPVDAADVAVTVERPSALNLVKSDGDVRSSSPSKSIKSNKSIGSLERDRTLKKLVNAHQVALAHRLRISGVCMVLGVGLAAGALAYGSVRSDGGFTRYIALSGGAYLLGCAILPNDRRAIRFTSIFCTIAFGMQIPYQLTWTLGDDSLLTNPAPCLNASFDQPRTHNYCIVQSAGFLADLLISCIVSALQAWSLRPRCTARGCRPHLYPRAALSATWRNGAILHFFVGLSWSCSLIGRLVFGINTNDPSDSERTAYSLRNELLMIAVVFSFVLAAQPQNRSRFVRFLAGSGAAAEEASAAASVSSVLGDRNVRAALEAGIASFKGLDFAHLCEADLASNAPSPQLAAQAQKASLGTVDIFFSHSWRDEYVRSDSNPGLASPRCLSLIMHSSARVDSPVHKWAALSKFTESFAAEHEGKLPKLWLDKACLDQGNIKDALAHLPVHLSGCQGLFITAGPTYTSRLWTLLEVFVWVAMGKGVSHMRLVAIPSPNTGGTQEDESAILRTTHCIDVRKAGCFDPWDRERILATIQSNIGSLRAFEVRVGNMLRSAFRSELSEHSNMAAVLSKGNKGNKWRRLVRQLTPRRGQATATVASPWRIPRPLSRRRANPRDSSVDEKRVSKTSTSGEGARPSRFPPGRSGPESKPDGTRARSMMGSLRASIARKSSLHLLPT